MSRETMVIGLGETKTVSAPAELKEGRWTSTGSAAVIDAPDGLESRSVKLVGAAVGRVQVAFRGEVKQSSDDAVKAKLIGGDHMERVQAENTHIIDVEVVPADQVKRVEAGESAVAATVPNKAAVAAGLASPLGVLGTSMTNSNELLNGMVPMKESQERPSEATPYGMDQDNRPVMPTGSMVAHDLSNVARASDEAEVGGELADHTSTSKVAVEGADTVSPTVQNDGSATSGSSKGQDAPATPKAPRRRAQASSKSASKSSTKTASKSSKAAATKRAATKTAGRSASKGATKGGRK